MTELNASKPPITSIASNLCRWKAAAIWPISIDGNVRFVPNSEPPRVVHVSTRSHDNSDTLSSRRPSNPL